MFSALHEACCQEERRDGTRQVQSGRTPAGMRLCRQGVDTLAGTGRVFEFETTGCIVLCRFSTAAGSRCGQPIQIIRTLLCRMDYIRGVAFSRMSGFRESALPGNGSWVPKPFGNSRGQSPFCRAVLILKCARRRRIECRPEQSHLHRGDSS